MLAQRTCLVVIDMVYADSHPDYALVRQLADSGIDSSYYLERVENTVVPNIRSLLTEARTAGVKVVYTEPSSYFEDYSDAGNNLRELYTSWKAKQSAADAHVRSELQPELGDAVLVKPSSSAWTSTPIDYMLRSAQIDHVVICGVVTNGCVIATALGAWDHGYTVTVVDDACATFSQAMHEGVLDILRFLQVGIASTAEAAGLCTAHESSDATAEETGLSTTMPLTSTLGNWSRTLRSTNQ